MREKERSESKRRGTYCDERLEESVGLLQILLQSHLSLFRPNDSHIHPGPNHLSDLKMRLIVCHFRIQIFLFNEKRRISRCKLHVRDTFKYDNGKVLRVREKKMKQDWQL